MQQYYNNDNQANMHVLVHFVKQKKKTHNNYNMNVVKWKEKMKH